MRRTLLVALAVACLLLMLPAAASAKVKWLCAPGLAKNPCTSSLRTTVFSTWDNQLRTVTPRRPRRPKVDCFYVYPTVSNQSGDIATKAIDPEISDIALFQAARYSEVCRVFAPVYRQTTVQGLTRGKYTAQPADGDLLEAWKLFLSKYSKGRGFVLIGHSQGTFRLVTLIRKQIDGNPRLRKRLVSAILLGGNVTVKNGSDRGGSFQNLPACRRDSQLRCVVAFSTYNETPPANSLFGRADTGFGGGTPGRQVLCTNPAALEDAPVDLDMIIPSKPYAPGTLIGAGIGLLRFELPKVPTPFIEFKAAVSGRCSTDGGASFLEVASKEGTPVPKASPDATWGLHLVDANIALGNLIRLVRTQARAYPR